MSSEHKIPNGVKFAFGGLSGMGATLFVHYQALLVIMFLGFYLYDYIKEFKTKLCIIRYAKYFQNP
uniref:DUF5683 domain-containing protein n=1 Tax=Heterorhabditis bacteriophora TaxID=37862 RepID=A0A1I7X0A5_HETBA